MFIESAQHSFVAVMMDHKSTALGRDYKFQIAKAQGIMNFKGTTLKGGTQSRKKSSHAHLQIVRAD